MAETLSVNFPFQQIEMENIGVNFKQGALNVMQPVILRDGRKAFWRRPKTGFQVAETLQGINFEYTQTGFISNGGGWGLRTLQEQVGFAAKCGNYHLPVAGVEMLEGNFAIVPVVHGETLADCLKKDNVGGEVVRNALDSVVKFHKAGIVLGDRWSKNFLVTPGGEIVHIDFDIKLHGELAPEFELAQAMYYLTLSKDGKMKEVVERWGNDILRRTIGYNQKILKSFLQNHWFLAEKYPAMNP